MKFGLALLFFLLPYSSPGQVSVSATLDSTNIVLGDPLRYFVTLQMPENTFFETPKLPKESNIELLAPPKSDTIKKDGDWVISQVWTITAYDSGVFTLPRMPYAYRLANGTKDTVFTPQKKIFCNTLPTDANMRPNMSIMEESIHFRDLVPYLLAGSILIGLAYGVYGWWRKRKTAQTTAAMLIETQTIPPQDLARQKIKALKAKNYVNNLEFKPYYTELSYILREYIEGQYGIAALESTSEELLNDLEKINPPVSVKMNLHQVLSTADIIKFAKGSANTIEMNQHLSIVERFVEEIIGNSENNIPTSI